MKVVNCKKEKYTHYIGRPSVFGNPFQIGKHGDRTKCIRMYKTWVGLQYPILAAINKLPADAILGCWCSPEPCHGDVIVDIWGNMSNL